MAAYDYRCRVCDSVFETRRSITDETPEISCPAGHTDVARVWSAVAITGSARSAGPQPAPVMAGGGGCCGGACGCG